jgi:hypothetical protein
VKTDSPQLGDLLKQAIDTAPYLGEPRGIPGRGARNRCPRSFLVVLSAHGS